MSSMPLNEDMKGGKGLSLPRWFSLNPGCWGASHTAVGGQSSPGDSLIKQTEACADHSPATVAKHKGVFSDRLGRGGTLFPSSKARR